MSILSCYHSVTMIYEIHCRFGTLPHKSCKMNLKYALMLFNVIMHKSSELRKNDLLVQIPEMNLVYLGETNLSNS